MGRYVVQWQFQEARRGQVYRALDQESGRIVVLRTFPARLGESRVPSHPRVAGLLEAGRVGSKLYLVTEDLGPRTLGAAGAPAPREALMDLLETVAGAQSQGALHRHLCPHNIHAVPGRGLVVADYGVPWMGADARFSEGVAPFLAPEARAAPWSAGFAAEAWSVGAIGWFLLAGEPPPADPRPPAPGGPEEVVRAIEGLLQRDPRRRWDCRRALAHLRESVLRIEA